MVGPGGVVAEQVLVQKYLSGPPQPMLRVRRVSTTPPTAPQSREVAKRVAMASLVL